MPLGEIIKRFIDEPAPFLSILHAIQEEHGYIPEPELRRLAEALKIPLAELFGTVTFYHYFRVEPSKGSTAYVCNGPVCQFQGYNAVYDDLKGKYKSVKEMSCPGKCDVPLAVMTNGSVYAGVASNSVEGLVAEPSPLPPNIELEECLFRNIRKPDQRYLNTYIKNGGYSSLQLAIDQPEKIIEIIKSSGLVGRGGAGFPTGAKLEAVRKAQGSTKYVICNADEGEPGCFKDRVLLDYDPHAVLEGMIIAGLTVGAEIGIIYLRYEYPDTYRILEKAIEEAKSAGLASKNVSGSGKRFEIYLRRGAGAYICGEETSLLNSLEGIRPFPREKPPYPTTHGFMKSPTVINNVETLAAIPPILQRGADWYRSLGCNGNAGTKIFSLSGDVLRPGNYELPLGTSLEELIFKHGKGTHSGRKVKAITMAGISGGYLSAQHLSTPLDIPSMKKLGTILGAGGVIVYDDSRCIVQIAQSAMNFFAHESCGKCYPCRIGTTRITEILDEMMHCKPSSTAISDMEDVGQVMSATSACGLGLAAPFVTQSMLKYWKSEVEDHIIRKQCQVGLCEF